MTDLFKVALYIRVSTERQANEGDSLEEQETELKKYCDFRQFSIHQIYIERGKSGGNTNRSLFVVAIGMKNWFSKVGEIGRASCRERV